MRGTKDEEIIQSTGAYEIKENTHKTRVCAYRSDNRRFSDTLLKDAVQTSGQQIRYCRVVSHHQNPTFERTIKEFTIGRRNILLHVTIL